MSPISFSGCSFQSSRCACIPAWSLLSANLPVGGTVVWVIRFQRQQVSRVPNKELRIMTASHNHGRLVAAYTSNNTSGSMQQEFGLSALHYAAWNGHVRCVEVLCVNDLGHDDAGVQRSCIDLQSCKGFTALHLSASDGVDGKHLLSPLVELAWWKKSSQCGYRNIPPS